ncbi:DUF898 family protein [Aestuariibius sp. 2305UL40-4]|uniref:DUF898 family protein n=1 Tax=Aestuariibius violaceus TaxID=3234132 RepID=UPI00398F5459
MPPAARAPRRRWRSGSESAPQPVAWPLADSPETTPSPELTVHFTGRTGPLFRLSVKTLLLTLVTLGLYRFWMKTRLRRWYWSAIRPGGDPIEYTGQPIEKLIGFLIAVCILAFYLAIVNLFLMFASLAIFKSNAVAYLASFGGTIPILFYAQYRARRYVLARTRWRGVRFGLRPAAWRYSGVALWQWVTVIASLGLLWPRKTFTLEKFVTDRTAFGSAELRQGGHWRMLIPAASHMLIGVVFTVLTILAAIEMDAEQAALGNYFVTTPFWFLLFLTIPYAVFGIIYYGAAATRIMAERKSAGPIGLTSAIRPAKIVRIYALGYGAILLAITPIFSGLSYITFLLTPFDDMEPPPFVEAIPEPVITAALVVLYFLLFLVWSALTHIFITMPKIRHYAETLTVTGANTLDRVSQKARDDFAEAEGFAEALDLGAAI